MASTNTKTVKDFGKVVFKKEQSEQKEYLLGIKTIQLEWLNVSAEMLLISDLTQLYLSEINREQNALRNRYRTLFIRAFNHEVRHPIHTVQLLTDQISEAIMTDTQINK